MSKIYKITHHVTTADGITTEYVQQDSKTIYLNYAVNVEQKKSSQSVQTRGSNWKLSQEQYDNLIRQLKQFIEICD